MIFGAVGAVGKRHPDLSGQDMAYCGSARWRALALAAISAFWSVAVVQPGGEIHGPAPKLPLWWVITVNAVAVLSTIQFFSLPRGERIRPMGWGMLLFLLAGAGFIGITLGMRKRYERMPCQWLVIVLGFSPFPLGLALFQLARVLRAFVVES